MLWNKSTTWSLFLALLSLVFLAISSHGGVEANAKQQQQPPPEKSSDTINKYKRLKDHVVVDDNRGSNGSNNNNNDARRRIGNMNTNMSDRGEHNRNSYARDEMKITKTPHHANQKRRNQEQKTPNSRSTISTSAPQYRLQTFFDNLLKLQHHYTSDLITVTDAPEAYPILAQLEDDDSDDCPFSYIPLQSGSDNNPSPWCYTPIITIHDRLANSYGTPPHQKFNAELPEVLLLGGLSSSSPSEMDISGPHSILETLRLLLECARCEALSPWVVNNKDDHDDDEDGTVIEYKVAGMNEKMQQDNLKDGEEKYDDIFIGDDDEDDESSSNAEEASHTTDAIQCRQNLASQGIDDGIRKWLARLVATRRIVAIPIVDVVGFHNKMVQLQQEEVTVDEQQMGRGAECDFPFPFHWESDDAATCMTTYPARVLNELIRSHAFQLGVAFHGGTKYETTTSEGDSATSWIEVPGWNTVPVTSVNYKYRATTVTFDEKAMLDISWAFTAFASTTTNSNNSNGGAKIFSVDAPRLVDPINDHCRSAASLEHFAFSAGMVKGGAGVNNEGSLWLQECQCDINDNDADDDACMYHSEQTGLYDGSSLRTFIAKVVSPPSSSTQTPTIIGDLGGLFFDPSFDPSNVRDYPCGNALYDPTPLGDKVRMSLLAAEIVEPYTAIRSVAEIQLRDDDVVPQSPRMPGACMHTRVMDMAESPLMNNVTVEWAVGGALEVAETAIMYGKWDVLDKKIFDCVTQPTKQELDAFFTILRDFEVMEGETAEEMAEDVTFTSVQSGVTRWHSSNTNNDGSGSASSSSSSATGRIIPSETIFSVSLDLSHYKVGDLIAVYSLARTDQGWVFAGDNGNGKGGRNSNPPPPAQSNIVNARTNPQWSHVHANSMDGEGSIIKGHLDWFSVPVTIKIGPPPGFFEGNEPIETSVRVSDEGYELNKGHYELDVVAYAMFMAVVVIALTVFCVFCREERDGTDVCSIWSEHRRINRQKISMDDFFKDEALELTTTTNVT